MERKRFLLSLGGGVLGWPGALAALDARWNAPDTGPVSRDFWDDVRAEFLIAPDRIYLNNGTLGPQPRVVVEAVREHTERVAMTFPPRLDWDVVKSSLAELCGGDAEGYVVSRNTTESMNVIANGLDFGAGDEVLTTDMEHIGGKSPWELLTERRGATLVIAPLPIPGRDPVTTETLFDAVWSHVTPRTRIISVSHVTFTNGTILPVERLAARCRDQGIIFVVDGAHPPGLMPIDIGAIGADFYASSPHKWLLAPQGSGMFWMAERWRDTLWPTLASGDWKNGGAQRFNHVGSLDESRVAGLLSALEFNQTIGMDRIWPRVQHLQARLRAGLESIDGLVLRSTGPELNAGMLSFEMEGIDSLELQGHLGRTANIRTRVIGEYDLGWMRLSTHLYNLESDVDRVLELLDEVARNGIPAAG